MKVTDIIIGKIYKLRGEIRRGVCSHPCRKCYARRHKGNSYYGT